MATTYKLTTLRDVFEQVPVDRIEQCMAEAARAMVQARLLADALNAAGSAIAAPGMALFWPEVCEWTDDGEPSTTTLHVTHEAKRVMTFETTSKGSKKEHGDG